MRRLLLALLGLVLMAAPALAQEPATQATQGQLATQLAWRLDLGPDTLPAHQAAVLLSASGVAPTGGWKVDQPLTYGTMKQVMHQIYASFDTNFPDKVVGWSALDKIVELESNQTCSFWRWRHNNRLLTEN
jgi:hypothetical protein